MHGWCARLIPIRIPVPGARGTSCILISPEYRSMGGWPFPEGGSGEVGPRKQSQGRCGAAGQMMWGGTGVGPGWDPPTHDPTSLSRRRPSCRIGDHRSLWAPHVKVTAWRCRWPCLRAGKTRRETVLIVASFPGFSNSRWHLPEAVGCSLRLYCLPF